MLESLKAFLAELHALWVKVGLNQKIGIGAVLAVFALALLLWGSWSSRDDYGLLFRDLQQKDGAEIVNSLKAQQIAFRVEDGGSTIMVPGSRVAELRLQLASQGLPREEEGWTLFDKNHLTGVSEFVQKINHTRALQAELERTIGRLKQIEWAKVHIVEARESLFSEKEEPATASVLIKTRSASALSDGQIAGITHLIAGAVRGLAPERVTITDHTGRQLSRGAGGADGPGLASNQLDFRREMEEHLSSRATQMLERVLGPGRAVVTVTADVDFTTSETSTIEYKDKVQKSTYETTKETTEAAASGEAGVAANLGGARPAGTGAVSTTREERVEYAAPLPTSNTRRQTPGGSVKRLAAAVFVNAGEYKMAAGPDGKQVRHYEPAPAKKTKEYEDIVKNAIGFVDTRDAVTVSDTEFRTAAELAPEEAAEIAGQQTREFIVGLVKSGSPALGLLVFLVFARRTLRRVFAPAPAQRPETLSDGTLSTATAAVEEAPATVTLKEQVAASVKEDPDRATRYLRTWMQT